MNKGIRIVKEHEIITIDFPTLKDISVAEYESEFRKVLENILQNKNLKYNLLDCKISEFKIANKKDFTESVSFRLKYDVNLEMQKIIEKK